MKPLAGKAALVTGSTSGIGLGIVRALAAAGADIVLNGFGETEVLRARLAEEFNVRVRYDGADIGRPAEMRRMVEQAERVDILVNNAGIQTADTGITCNPICPGWVLTPLVQKQIDDLSRREKISGEEAKKRLLLEKQPSGEFATPEQIGALAAFLCSEAASQIRGAALPVDGGWTAQ